MDKISGIYDILLTAAVIVLAVLIIISIIRSVLGPGIADRIIAVNMIGTMIIMIIAILSVYLDENYLVDVCLIYAMLSFLGVVVLCKVYTGVYLQRKNIKADLSAIDDNLKRQTGMEEDRKAGMEEDGKGGMEEDRKAGMEEDGKGGMRENRKTAIGEEWASGRGDG